MATTTFSKFNRPAKFGTLLYKDEPTTELDNTGASGDGAKEAGEENTPEATVVPMEDSVANNGELGKPKDGDTPADATAPDKDNETAAVTAPETVDESNPVKEDSKETEEKNADPQAGEKNTDTATGTTEEEKVNTEETTETPKKTEEATPPDADTTPEQDNETVAVTAPETVDESNSVNEDDKEAEEKNADAEASGATTDGNEPVTSEVENGQDVNDTEKKADKDGDTSKTAEGQKDPTGDETTATGDATAASSEKENTDTATETTEEEKGNTKETTETPKKTEEATPPVETPVANDQPDSGEDKPDSVASEPDSVASEPDSVASEPDSIASEAILHEQPVSEEDTAILYDQVADTLHEETPDKTEQPKTSPDETEQHDKTLDAPEQVADALTPDAPEQPASVEDKDTNDAYTCCCLWKRNPTNKGGNTDLEKQIPTNSSTFLYY